MKTLTLPQTRSLMLAAQGLLTAPQKTATKADVLACIRRMQLLQIDTISVVARSPYFVLWSRLGDYDPTWLEDLLEEGDIFEYWAHAACFIPIEDYRLYRRIMLNTAPEDRYRKKTAQWLRDHADQVEAMLAHIRENGAVRSSDFERPDGRKGDGWWDWKAEKLILENLFYAGKLMIARRDKFQRIYDLQERVMPAWDDSTVPPMDEVLKTFVANTVKALGVTKLGWIADYYRMYKKDAQTATDALLQEGALCQVEVAGWDEPGYVHAENADLMEKAADNALVPDYTVLLSPFDPLVWHRERASELFGFEYRIECYTPAAKRQYGYFTLPILHRGALVGRLDPKAHRKEGRFEVKALHLEPDVPVNDALIHDLADAIKRCAAWHNTPDVEIVRSDPPDVAGLVRGVL